MSQTSRQIMLQYYINGYYTDLLLAELLDHYRDQTAETWMFQQGWDGYLRRGFYMGQDMTMTWLKQLGNIHYFNIIELTVRYKDEFPFQVLRTWRPRYIREGFDEQAKPLCTDMGENADFILPWGIAVKDTVIPPGPNPKDPGVRREIPEELRPISPS